MSDIELVIKISEKTYNALTHAEFDANLVADKMRESIVQGTPLPKGHGDLIDRNDVSLMTVHIIDGVFVCNASTIIKADKAEADKAEEEDNKK